MPEYIPGLGVRYNPGEAIVPPMTPGDRALVAEVNAASPKAQAPSPAQPVTIEQAMALADQRHSIAHSISSQRVDDPDKSHEYTPPPPASLTG